MIDPAVESLKICGRVCPFSQPDHHEPRDELCSMHDAEVAIERFSDSSAPEPKLADVCCVQCMPIQAIHRCDLSQGW